jgi:hypothetical protein
MPKRPTKKDIEPDRPGLSGAAQAGKALKRRQKQLNEIVYVIEGAPQKKKKRHGA